MTALYISLYILSCLFCFLTLVNYERKEMYVNKEALFFMILFSALWPLSLILISLMISFEWLEKVVNKK